MSVMPKGSARAPGECLRWALAGAVGGFLGVWATAVEPFRLQATQRRIVLGDGGGPTLTIALLTDAHVQQDADESVLPRAVPLVTARRPDLIVIVGDILEHARCDAAGAVGWLRQLEAPLGVHTVFGGHEGLRGNPGSPEELQELRPLHHAHRLLATQGRPFALAGIDEPEDNRFDLSRALADLPPGLPVILLSHTPDVIYPAARAGVDLVLCGHTHGGQVKLPGYGAVCTYTRYGRRFAGGLFRVRETQMYVCRGLGTTGAHVRFWCRPELAFLEVRLPGTESRHRDTEHTEKGEG